MLDYAIVVATRNRLDALQASVPLFLNQTRQPARLIVVDRSDDHAAVAAYLEEVAVGTSIPIEVIHSDKGNLPYQRNLGIERVTEPVTMMPDDDSLWFSDTAERFMDVYEKDTKGLIGGVAGIETDLSPLGNGPAPKNARRFIRRPWIERWRNRIEETFAPQPFNIYARPLIARHTPAAQAQGLGDLRFVETIAGWRMSFRTDVVRRIQFDPTLGSRVGHGLHEDKEMELRLQRAGYLLAAAPGAKAFHNFHPSGRGSGFAYGFLWLFNYAYICRKVFGCGPPGKGSVLRYLRYKQFLYRLRRGNSYHREIARGGAAAMTEFDRMWQAPDDRLAEVYGEICDRVLKTT